METITNYPKIARARIIFYIDLVIFVIETIVAVLSTIAICLYFKKIKQSLAQDHATVYDDGRLITMLIVIILAYLIEGAILYLLYKGVIQKNPRKLGIWLIGNAVIILFLLISILMELIEEKFVSGWPSAYTIIWLIYRFVAMKIVHDALQEVRRFPVSVPFVQMRDCEERV